jgi:hypothetical protein
VGVTVVALVGGGALLVRVAVVAFVPPRTGLVLAVPVLSFLAR